jgi:hypothetical protein
MLRLERVILDFGTAMGSVSHYHWIFQNLWASSLCKLRRARAVYYAKAWPVSTETDLIAAGYFT